MLSTGINPDPARGGGGGLRGYSTELTVVCLVFTSCVCCAGVSVCSEQHEHSSVVMDLLNRKTAKEQAKLEQYRSHGAAVQAQCEHMTKEACRLAHNAPKACHKMHKR